MDAFTVAREILGGTELSTEQLAQLRAINHEYAQRLYALRRSPGTAGSEGERHSGEAPGRRERELTGAELVELRESLETALFGILTPEQRRRVQRR